MFILARADCFDGAAFAAALRADPQCPHPRRRFGREDEVERLGFVGHDLGRRDEEGAPVVGRGEGDAHVGVRAAQLEVEAAHHAGLPGAEGASLAVGIAVGRAYEGDDGAHGGGLLEEGELRVVHGLAEQGALLDGGVDRDAAAVDGAAEFFGLQRAAGHGDGAEVGRVDHETLGIGLSHHFPGRLQHAECLGGFNVEARSHVAGHFFGIDAGALQVDAQVIGVRACASGLQVVAVSLQAELGFDGAGHGLWGESVAPGLIAGQWLRWSGRWSVQ